MAAASAVVSAEHRLLVALPGWRPQPPSRRPAWSLSDPTLDLAIAVAATAGRSAQFAPLAEPGITRSERQVERVAAIHPKPPVLAPDGDPAGGGANVAWVVALAKGGRESVIVTWPAGEDPASWLAAHGTAGLDAIARKGCLDAAAGTLRPQRSGAQVAARLVGDLPPTAGLEGRWRAGLAPVARMGPAGVARYATAATEVLAPVVVGAAAQASNDGPGRVNDVTLVVASFGRRLPEPAQVRFAGLAAYEIERADLAPAGWAQRRIQAGSGEETTVGVDETMTAAAAVGARACPG